MNVGDRTDRDQNSMLLHRFLIPVCPITHVYTRVLEHVIPVVLVFSVLKLSYDKLTVPDNESYCFRPPSGSSRTPLCRKDEVLV